MAKKKKRIKLNETEILFILVFPFALLVVFMDVFAPENPLRTILSIFILIVIYMLSFIAYSFYLSYKKSRRKYKKRKSGK